MSRRSFELRCDPFSQQRGLDRFGLAAESQDPTSNVFERRERHRDFDLIATGSDLSDFLTRVPAALGDYARRKTGETNFHRVMYAPFLFAGPDPETARKVILKPEIPIASKSFCREVDGFHSLHRKGPPRASIQIESDHIPAAVDLGEVIGLKMTPRGSGVREFLVIKVQFATFQNGFGKTVKNENIALGHAGGFHRERLIDVRPGDRDLLAHSRLEALKSAPEGSLERRTLQLSEGIPRENEGDEIFGGRFEKREIVYRARVVVSVLYFVILEREFHLLPHEIEISLDCLAIDFQLPRDGTAIRKMASGNQVVNSQHSLERAPRTVCFFAF